MNVIPGLSVAGLMMIYDQHKAGTLLTANEVLSNESSKMYFVSSSVCSKSFLFNCSYFSSERKKRSTSQIVLP